MNTKKYNKILDDGYVVKYFSKAANGFTLTEVIITTIIVGILGSIALPNYHFHPQKQQLHFEAE